MNPRTTESRRGQSPWGRLPRWPYLLVAACTSACLQPSVVGPAPSLQATGLSVTVTLSVILTGKREAPHHQNREPTHTCGYPYRMRTHPILAPFLADDGVLLLDGGLATELEARGHGLSDALWSARLLRDDPAAIQTVHEAYFEAGARVAISASYQASVAGFARAGVGEVEAEALMRRSVALAVEAREAFLVRRASVHTARVATARPLVAASIGPYGATQADGSEYTGDYALDDAGLGALARFHRQRLAVLADAGADLLACETIPSGREAMVLLDLLRDLPADSPPAWLSLSCRDGRSLRDGTPIEVVAARAQASDRLVAFGVNCVDPEHVLPLLQRAARETDLPLVAYPNKGERWDAKARCWVGGTGWDEASLAGAARAWRAAGAWLIGGCCRTGPADIAALEAAP